MRQSLYLILVAILLVSLFAFPSFADTYEIAPYYSSQPDAATIQANSCYCNYNHFGSSSESTLALWYYDGIESASHVVCLFADSVPFTFYNCGSNGVVYSDSSVSYYLEETGLYYNYAGGIGSTNISGLTYLGVFDSRLAALQSISQSVVNRFSFDIPAGYMLQIVSDNDITITRRFYTISNSWNFVNLVSVDGSYSYRSNGAKQGSVATASLVSGADIDNLVSSNVQWQPSNENLLGRASDYSYLNDIDFEVVSAGDSYCLVYPYYYGQSDPQTNTADLHCVFDVNYVGSVTFNLIGLDNISYVVDGSTFTKNIVDTDLGSTGSQTDTGDGVTVDFGSDNATGGGNANDAALDDDQTVSGVFTRFINGITGLFHSASDAIQTLLQESNDFFSNVLAMFNWLPSEVLTILFAAFTVLIVIGVVKHIL